MPLLTTVLEDTSPLLVYSSNWRAGTSADDPSADKYSQSSFTVTQTAGASVSLNFYGSSVTVFGARRGNHGNYGASIDNLTSTTQVGHAAPDQFNQVLYSANVSPGSHNMTITNSENQFFDVDYVMIQSSIGQDNESLIVNTFQDSHPAFAYTPPSSWTTPSSMIGSFEGGSGHATTNPSAVANFTFQGNVAASPVSPQLTTHPGDAVALYGPVGPNSSATFSVQVDDGDPAFFSANKQFFRPQQILFYAGNLGVGEHSLKVQFVQSPIAGELAIDYASVYTTPSLGGSFFGAAASFSPMRKSRSISTAVIVELAITIPAVVLITVLLFYIWWLRRRSKGFPVQGLQADRLSHSLRDQSDLIQPFSLANPPNPRPPNPQRRTMSQKLDGLHAVRGHHGASSSVTSALASTGGTSYSVGTSAQGGTPNPNSSSIVTVDASFSHQRNTRDQVLSAPAPPPEYTQTSDN